MKRARQKLPGFGMSAKNEYEDDEEFDYERRSLAFTRPRAR